MPTPHLAVADDRAAEALAEEQVGKIGWSRLGAGCPVHVVVDGDRTGHEPPEDLHRIELADQERGIGQLDQTAGRAGARIGRAADGPAWLP